MRDTKWVSFKIKFIKMVKSVTYPFTLIPIAVRLLQPCLLCIPLSDSQKSAFSEGLTSFEVFYDL